MNISTIDTPKVSIGLPVFNGENYIAETIQLILAQTFSDFELIIYDNASTDRTADICDYFIANDNRIRYFKNPENLGAGRNYDHCFHKARGEYFKWAAHDDMIRNDFLMETVTLLDNTPDAVLCGFPIQVINAEGKLISQIYINTTELESEQPSTRFLAVFKPRVYQFFFGLFRRSALIGTQLHNTFKHSDYALLAEVSLRGKFIQSKETIFRTRRHKESYTESILTDRNAVSNWMDTRNRKKSGYTRLTFFTMLLRNIIKSNISLSEKKACIKNLYHNYNTVNIRREIIKDFRYMFTPKRYYKE